MSECSWPFACHIKDCVQCRLYEEKYAEGVEEWLRQKQEIREAKKRRNPPSSGSE